MRLEGYDLIMYAYSLLSFIGRLQRIREDYNSTFLEGCDTELKETFTSLLVEIEKAIKKETDLDAKENLEAVYTALSKSTI